MKYRFNAGTCTQYIVGVSNVAANKVDARVGERLCEVKHAHALAAFDKRLDDRAPEEARAANYEVVALRQRDKAL